MARDSLIPFGFGAPMGADPFVALHREMNRLFADVLGGGGAGARGAQPGGQGSGMMLVPQMEVSETQNEIRITAELPGVSEKDIEVILDDDVLTVRAEKKVERNEDRQNVHFTERGYGVFQRSIRLPYRVSADEVRANFENGVLTVTVPKSQARQASSRVQVQGPRTAGQSGDGNGQGPSSSADGGRAGDGGGSSTSTQNTGTSASSGSSSP